MKARVLAAVVGLCLPAFGPLAGQQITCESPAGTQPGAQPVFPWQDHFIALSRLGNHWMPFFGDGDSMTSPFWHDQGALFPFGSAGLQESWYVPRDPAAGRAALYRLFDPVLGNHMDSPFTAEGPHTLDLGSPHGYPWTSSQTGTRPIRRYYRAAINDHRTWLNTSTPPGYVTNATWSAGSATPRFGYQRYGNYLDQCSAIGLANTIGTKLQNSKLRVGFNPIWGNAIGEITHLPTGRQIASHSIGDMVQSTLWYGGPPGKLLNPTQSGGVDCWDYGATRRWTGSPVLSASLSGTNPKSFTTQVRPLNFCHNDFQGNNSWSPLAWQGTFRLTTTLGCKLGATTYDDVIKVRHEARKDATAPFTDNPINMNNVGWLIPHSLGDCRDQSVRFDVVDLVTGLPVATYHPSCNDPTVKLISASNKGLMLTSADQQFAVGFARLDNAPGDPLPDPVDELNFAFNCNFDCSLNNQKIILNYFNFHNLSSSSFRREEVFWVLGPPSDVLLRLQQVWADGGDCAS